MYSGELETQIKRKMIALLQDETSRLLNAGRDLLSAHELISNNDNNTLLDKFREYCNNIDEINRKATREISEIGGMMLSREDLLRTIYLMSEIAGCLDGIAFRLSALRLDNNGTNTKVYELIDLVVEELFKLNEITRAMSINPQSIIDLVSEVQKVEKEVDQKYRELLLTIMNEKSDFKELLLLKDVLDGIENVADRCLEAADSLEIITLNM
ncbi:MAG: hypothetical protein KatS3mg003_0485 [Candidatus Nitrosocaldaceae archaeon]|nr:MAG: hypothetical protein KatS3mg003_0485 [Candidatus Nitrosocaldaceae archaeon]